ncbi:hypothetical protein [Niveispirillum fermenti]|uniref:hypothetical protein n=1 Tax=Niveispirillum fermenti TaxID=1233113 RepID=UPI003A88DE1F
MITYEDMLAFAGVDDETVQGLAKRSGLAPVLACGLVAARRLDGEPVPAAQAAAPRLRYRRLKN